MASSAPGRVRLRFAGALSILVGLGFGLPGVYGTWYFAANGGVWSFMGFPTYGDGPFEDIGIRTTAPLLVAFVMLCAAEVVCGLLLWQARRSGVVMAVVLLPFELAFWIGFLLPFGFPAGIVRTMLAVWPSHRAPAHT